MRLITNKDGTLTVEYFGKRDNPNLEALGNHQDKNGAVKRTRDQITKDGENGNDV